MNDLVWDHIFNVTGNKEILDGALKLDEKKSDFRPERSYIESY